MKKKIILLLMLCFVVNPLNSLILSLDKVQASSDQASIASDNNENSPFGVNGHVFRRYYPQERDTAFSKMAEVGAKWEREEFTWDFIEPTQDQYDWSGYDDVVLKANANHINISGLIAYSAIWASTGKGLSDEDKYLPNLDAWADFVGKLVERYDGDGINDALGSPVVQYWELWNEPNLNRFLKINNMVPDDKEFWYGQLLKRGYQAAKQANPDSVILSGAVSGADVYFLNRVIEKTGGCYFDIFATNILRNLSAPEEFMIGYDTLQYQLGQSIGFAKKYNKKIWVTEAGWPTDVVSEEDQADYIARLYSISLSFPDIEKIFVYTFRDDSSGDWGMVRNDFSEKPSFFTYKFLSEKLQGTTFRNQDDVIGSTTIDNFEGSLSWNLWNFSGATSSFEKKDFGGNKALKVNYNLPYDNTSAYISLNKNAYLGGGNPVIKFKIYGDNNLNVCIRIIIKDSTGEIFQGYAVRSPYSGWQKVIVNFNDSGQRAVHWGGNGDGVIDQPASFESIVIDKEKDKENPNVEVKGSIYFDDIAYCYDNNLLFKNHYLKDGQEIITLWSKSGSSTKNIFVNGDSAEGFSKIGASAAQTISSNGFLNNFNINESVYFLEPNVSSSSSLSYFINPKTNPFGYSFWWDYGIPNNTIYRDWFFTQVVPNNSYLYSMLWDK
ncbi:hypothetical protein AUJ93_02750, partial [bacterium CG2_30_33_46]